MAQGPETKWATEVLLKEITDLRARLSAAEQERDVLMRDQPAGVKHFRRRALAAEARVEALSEALRQVVEVLDQRMTTRDMRLANIARAVLDK